MSNLVSGRTQGLANGRSRLGPMLTLRHGAPMELGAYCRSYPSISIVDAAWQVVSHLYALAVTPEAALT
jgi:hypothetical protein